MRAVRAEDRHEAAGWEEIQIARAQLNRIVRENAVRLIGADAVDQLVREQVEANLVQWLGQHLDELAARAVGQGRKPNAGSGPDWLSDATRRDAWVVERMRASLVAPSLLVGVESVSLAAAIEVQECLEQDLRVRDAAAEAFETVQFPDADFFELSGEYRTILAVDYLDHLAQVRGYEKMKSFFPQVWELLCVGGRLLVSDRTAYQDDVVSSLASLEFEIEEITSLGGGSLMGMVAVKL